MFLCSAAAAVYGAGWVAAVGDGAGVEFSTQGARRGSESSFPLTHLAGSAHAGSKLSVLYICRSKKLIYTWNNILFNFRRRRLKFNTNRSCYKRSKSKRPSLLQRSV